MNAVNVTNSPFFQQFTKEQMYKGYMDSAEGLMKLRDKAIEKGEKVNGRTAEQWDSDYKRFLEIADKYK